MKIDSVRFDNFFLKFFTFFTGRRQFDEQWSYYCGHNYYHCAQRVNNNNIITVTNTGIFIQDEKERKEEQPIQWRSYFRPLPVRTNAALARVAILCKTTNRDPGINETIAACTGWNFQYSILESQHFSGYFILFFCK